MSKASVIAAVLICLWLPALSEAADGPGAFDFKQGTDRPDGWQLSGGAGRWAERDWLEVTGKGDDSNYWSHDFDWEPGRLYQFRMRARRPRGSGCVISGPAFANRDQYGVSDEWRWFGHVFCYARQRIA